MKTLFGGVITNNVVSLVSAGIDFERRNIKLKENCFENNKAQLNFVFILIPHTNVIIFKTTKVTVDELRVPQTQREVHFLPLFFLTVLCLPQDCDHVSQTAEEFYTVRCQVADMKNIYVSGAKMLRKFEAHL